MQKTKKLRILKIHNDYTRNPQMRKDNSYGGCGYYRTIKVAEQLSPEHEVTIWGREFEDEKNEFANEEHFYEQLFQTYDIVWLHYMHNQRTFAWLRAAATKHGKKLVMDIDDNFLDLHDKNPAAEAYKHAIKKGKKIEGATRSILSTILSFCDAITVSTVPLKERLATHFKEVHGIEVPIFVVPNYNDIKDWNFESKKNKDGVVIGYMGSVSHAEDFEMILPALKTLLEKYPKLVFQLMGQLTHPQAQRVFKNWPQDMKDRIFMINPSVFKDFPRWLSIQPWDIGIAPLIESPFNECKSHIKWMEYSMYYIPTVASKVYPYYKDVLGKQTIEDGVTGILAKENEWVEKLSELIENKELRDKIGQQAFDFVSKEWQYKDAKPHILKTVEQISML